MSDKNKPSFQDKPKTEKLGYKLPKMKTTQPTVKSTTADNTKPKTKK